MRRKSKQKKNREPQKIVSQKQQKSSWRAVLVSILKEFFLNPGSGAGYDPYDENLNGEGKQKKNLIQGSLILVVAVAAALLPFYAWDRIVPDVLLGKIFVVVICEAYAVCSGVIGIITLKNGLKHK